MKKRENPITRGSKPSFKINQFLVRPNFDPKTPIPPVKRIFINPRIEITFIFFLVIKS